MDSKWFYGLSNDWIYKMKLTLWPTIKDILNFLSLTIQSLLEIAQDFKTLKNLLGSYFNNHYSYIIFNFITFKKTF